MTREEIGRQFAGKWVAVKDGIVVEAWDHPHGLVMRLSERGIKGATIMRCPGVGEPLLVGLG